ncbi:D-tyrosyl-tRNA(Tyr) deacylase [Caldimicrobium thiodismutans]|uniref:D-aminoacyl-tRNA deacylase n=1 Tax=Caldimicrobium thiodismutans TaxID=1653476 RepID=A0A0U4N482_9BACT|nr:D-aminoacyl-tRNA deacylase [Caldimicrobium thiodismutans]BAU24102.1 D-tyrosyl-tRNA(Tyr) deacylase [Caldimicrobium thiodismutans]
MKAVIQRVKFARVLIEGKVFSEIGRGLLALVCAERGDDENVLSWIAEKLVNLRIFPDADGKFNLNVKDISGEILLVSNFTICGQLKKGTRPSFHLSEEPELAKALLEKLAEKIRKKGVPLKEGVFGAHMEIELVNDGPVTIYLEKINPAYLID